MRSSRGMKFIAVLACTGILVMGLTSLGFAFGVNVGVQGSQPSGDQSTNTQGEKGSVKPAPFGVKVGVQGSQPSGDQSTNTAGPPGSVKPAPFGVKVGVQGSQPSGDQATSSAKK